MPSKYYAYRLGTGDQGIKEDWDKVRILVTGRAARYKGFKTKEEAQKWLDDGAEYEEKIAPELQKGIYFDAGTGRTGEVEVSVTDKEGNNLLHQMIPKHELNAFGKYPLKDKTNNYGELMGCFLALKIAIQNHEELIYGDAKLIIDYWSKGHIKADKPEETKELANAVSALRKEFENLGGTLKRISGDFNPADLGFHR